MKIKRLHLFFFFLLSIILSLYLSHGRFSFNVESEIFLYIRIPRTILAFLVGAGLTLVGAVYQVIFRNPLATPFTLGIAQGASFGAVVGIIFFNDVFLSIFSGITILSFCGAILTLLFIYFIVHLKRSFSPFVILLCGVAVSFFFSSLVLFLEYVSDFTQGFQILRWLMGSLSTIGYKDVLALSMISFPVFFFLYLFRHHIFILSLGDELATNRGIDVKKLRMMVFFITSLLIGIMVSVCGPIGFVGLIIPHLVNLLTDGNFKDNFLWYLLGGGSFLMLCDSFARTIIYPAEIPIGVITSLLGGPFFIWVLFNYKGKKSLF